MEGNLLAIHRGAVGRRCDVGGRPGGSVGGVEHGESDHRNIGNYRKIPGQNGGLFIAGKIIEQNDGHTDIHNNFEFVDGFSSFLPIRHPPEMGSSTPRI